MGKETYQIYDFVPDIVMAFASVFSVKGKITYNEDEMISTDRLKLASYNPKDTTLVATFFGLLTILVFSFDTFFFALAVFGIA